MPLHRQALLTPRGGGKSDPKGGLPGPRRRCATLVMLQSYVRKLVTELSGGVFGYLDSVLERHSFDEFGELI